MLVHLNPDRLYRLAEYYRHEARSANRANAKRLIHMADTCEREALALIRSHHNRAA